MSNLQKLELQGFPDSDEDALVQVLVTGINLESVKLRVHLWAIEREPQMRIATTFKRIVNSISSHHKLQYFECYTAGNIVSEVYDEIRAVVQCMRNRRVLFRYGRFDFLYGKRVTSRNSVLES